jgi:hypothetical protein
MNARDAEDNRPPGPPAPFDDELIGLDPDDPEAQAFAAHLDRMRKDRPGYTVEGYLQDVGDFANSANRLSGHRRLTAVIVTVLILAVVAFLAWEVLGTVLTTFLN